MTTTEEAASPAEPHRRRSWVLVAAATVVVIGGGSAVVALRGDDTAHPSAPTAIRTGSAVATWLRNNVAPSATVATIDPVLQRGLAAAGLDVTDTGSADTLPTGAYLVGVPSAAGTSAPIEITGGRSLVPVARFTDGASSVQVGQLVGRTPEQVTAATAAERTTAAAAAAGLLQNAGLTVGAVARPVFLAGTLDLRAAAFLALLANSTPTEVVQVPADAVERAVGLTDRRVVVVVADPATLQSAAAGTRPPFAPEIAPVSGKGLPVGSVTLTWPLSADPTSVVS